MEEARANRNLWPFTKSQAWIYPVLGHGNKPSIVIRERKD